MSRTDDLASLSSVSSAAHWTGALHTIGFCGDTAHEDFAMTSQEQEELIAHDVANHHGTYDYFDVLVTLMHNPLIDDEPLMQSG